LIVTHNLFFVPCTYCKYLIVCVTSVPVLCIGCLRDKVLKIEYKHQDACDMPMSWYIIFKYVEQQLVI